MKIIQIFAALIVSTLSSNLQAETRITLERDSDHGRISYESVSAPVQTQGYLGSYAYKSVGTHEVVDLEVIQLVGTIKSDRKGINPAYALLFMHPKLGFLAFEEYEMERLSPPQYNHDLDTENRELEGMKVNALLKATYRDRSKSSQVFQENIGLKNLIAKFVGASEAAKLNQWVFGTPDSALESVIHQDLYESSNFTGARPRLLFGEGKEEKYIPLKMISEASVKNTLELLQKHKISDEFEVIKTTVTEVKEIKGDK